MNELDSILVASDLTEASNLVVRTAGQIAAATGARLHLVHAFDIPAPSGPVQDSDDRPNFLDRVRQAREALNSQVQSEVPEGVTIGECRVEIYVAEKAIAELAESLQAQLIVVGPHGRRRMGDDFLGGTADRVIRAARIPVLVVRAAIPLPLQRVVTPVDRSEVATSALEVAIDWAGALAPEGSPAEVIAVHILPRALNTPELNLDPEEIRQGIHREVERVAEQVLPETRVTVLEEVRWGESAVDEIVSYLQEAPADLVVMGTHGPGIVKRFLIGSVASGVARQAPCSVLLVPPGMRRAGGGERSTS